MAIIKCKMCGGDLNLIEGASTAECEFCGSIQTIPKVDDEKKLTLFARANRLRAACEFDKAAGIYEAIVADFPEEAEAYWGLVLCKYGIEYVDDPATGKKIPTCHRSSFDSIMEDSNFEQAQENADITAQKVYREEAKQFERIRKGILEVSSTEKPYDIFICYKETDEKGERTLDSVLAQDLYSALTDKGYRVFFSRITLQGKLGEAYEPYIFAALNSAKVMLSVGTCYEYYNAVWVKNEWSRYLKICEADKSRHLIPCYKDLDPEDMPREFNHLQGADLGKMGAVQDILFNMEKYIPLKKETTTVIQKETVAASSNNPTTDSYLKRAFMFLEDGDWRNADEYCEKVLDIDPENARAYLGKLLAELNIKKQEELQDHVERFTKNNNYQKILRFADPELRGMLQSFEERLARKKEAKAEQRRRAKYNYAIKLLEQGEQEAAYRYLRSLSGYEDADALLNTIKKDILATLAPVKQNGKWGYINEAGEMVIKPQFDADGSWKIKFYSNGLACVKQNGKWGLINEAGKMVIQPQFDDTIDFAPNGLARVERNDKYGYINEAGEMVIQPQFDYAYHFTPNGLAPVQQNRKYGYINEAGEMVIQPQFGYAHHFAPNGLACVGRNGWGYINEAGEMVIQPQYDYAHNFAPNGLACVKQNGKWGLINEVGEMVIKPQFDDSFDFADNGLARVKQNYKYGFINEAGEMVIKPQFDNAYNFAPNGLTCVERNGKRGYINEAGEMVIELQCDYALNFSDNGLALVKQNYKYGYINETGKMVIKPQFEDVGGFTPNGLACVERNGEWGYINEAGKMVIEPQFEDAGGFKIIFHSEVERAKHIQERVAEEKRIAKEIAAEERLIAEEKARQRAAQQAKWRDADLCQHCGGTLKGFFSKKCVSCGKPKDY